MTDTSTLTPCSVGLNSTTIGTSRDAVQTVSEFAQGSISLVPVLEGMPDWYAPIQTAVTQAQTQSHTWLSTLCPAVTNGLPQQIVDFNTTFDTQSTNILNVLSAAGTGTPTAAQKQAVAQALNAILTQTQAFSQTAAGVQKQLAAYTTQLVADVNALGTAISTLEGHLIDGSQYVQKLKQAYTENFVKVEGKLTPCNVIVMLDMDISIKVTMTGAPQEAIAIVIAQTLIGLVDHNVQQAMPAVQVVMDSWATLHSKITAVLGDLDGVETDLPAFLEQFDFKAAQDQWGELSDYAVELLP